MWHYSNMSSWMEGSVSSSLLLSFSVVDGISYLWPTWDIYAQHTVLSPDIAVLSLVVVEWSRWSWLCVKEC